MQFGTSNVYMKTAQFSASGFTTVWTPNTGKRWNLTGLQVTSTSNASLSLSAGLVTISMYDGSTAMDLAWDVYVSPAASITSLIGCPQAWNSGPFDLKTGLYGSSATDQALRVNLSTSLTNGNFRINVSGFESS